MAVITIYGLECSIPQRPKDKDIAGYGITFRKQKFKRTEIPESFEELTFDEDKNPIYSPEQERFILQEIQRCTDGYWFWNKGEPTWITGDHYYYLNYWTLEDGSIPEYRDSDRRFFIFLNEARNDDYILGVVRGKKRREGATSQATCVGVKTATFNENARCGNISKTGKDAEDLFVNMIVYGFRALPIFLKPRYDGTEDPRRRLVLVKPVSKKQQVNLKGYSNKREGLNSWIDFRNTALNSYDSGRLTFILIDESGKMTDMDISTYWQIVSQTLLQGAKKVGFALLPTTVNPPNAGGERFKIFWDKCNQFIHGRRTPTRLIQYFQPAEDGLPGFIDEWGMSDMEGAGKWLDEEYEKLETEDDRSEFKRMYPRKEQDMFTFAQSASPFNLEILDNQIDWLKQNGPVLRVGHFYRDENGVPQWADDKKGKWHILRFPVIPNRWTQSGREKIPDNTLNHHGGVDTFRLNTEGEYSSPGVIWIADKQDQTPIAFYEGRPKDKNLFFEECLMAAQYYGCKLTFEIDATDDYEPHFRERGCIKFLSWTPDAAMNPRKKKKAERGVRSADPFSLERQLELGILWVEHHAHKCQYAPLLEDKKKYQHSNRTQRNKTVAWMMCLMGLLGDRKAQAQEKKKVAFVETFKVRL